MWAVKKLGDVCDVKGGGTPSKSNESFYEGNIPWATVRDMRNERLSCTEMSITEEAIKNSSTNLIPSGTIITATRVGLGKVCVLEQDTAINQDLKAIIPKTEELDNTFLYWWLKSIAHVIVGAGTGATVQGVKLTFVKALEIPLPTLPEQKRIVALLDTVSADLEQTRAKTEQNLKNARELFDSYLQQVFSQKGEGWEEKKWGDMCKFIRGPFGGSLKKSMFKPEGYAVYEQKHAIHDHIEQLRYYVDEEKFEEMKRFELKPGELIMSCSGVTLGKASVIPEGAPKGIINQALLKLTANDNLDIHFLKYWIRSKIFQDIIFEHAGGAAIPNVPAAKILKEIKLQIPTIEKQKTIVSEIDSMVSKRDSLLRINTEKLAALDELKKSILQKAFSGELTTTAK